MRILISADPEIQVPPNTYGGIQRIVAHLIDYLMTQGHTVGLVAHRESAQTQHYFKAWKTETSQGAISLYQNTRILELASAEFKPDVLHSFSRLAFSVHSLLKAKPVVMSYQREPGLRQVALASLLSRSSLYYTGCSDYISNLGKQSASNWRTIPNFLADTVYTPNYSVPKNAPLLFLSRLDRIKGAHTAIAIAKKLEHPLIIAGTIPDQVYFDTAIAPHVDGTLIQYAGSVNDSEKQDLIANARALLLPIEWDEPFGIVYIEALACGTPVITAARGAAPEIIQHGISGFICSNLQEYYESIPMLDTLNRESCYQHFSNNFSAGVVCPQYENLYTDCIKQR